MLSWALPGLLGLTQVEGVPDLDGLDAVDCRQGLGCGNERAAHGIVRGHVTPGCQAAVEGSSEAVLRLDDAMALLNSSAEELSAYIAAVLGPGGVADDGNRGSGETAARHPARLDPSTPFRDPAERATAVRLAHDPTFHGRVFSAPQPPDPD